MSATRVANLLVFGFNMWVSGFTATSDRVGPMLWTFLFFFGLVNLWLGLREPRPVAANGGAR